jgi:hypothetical protein
MIFELFFPLYYFHFVSDHIPIRKITDAAQMISNISSFFIIIIFWFPLCCKWKYCLHECTILVSCKSNQKLFFSVVFEQGWCGLEGIFVGAVSENGREL